MNIHFSKNIAAMLLCLLYALNGFCGDKPVKPITGTWINLAYRDVRNKYTNPTVSDNTGPELWGAESAGTARDGYGVPRLHGSGE